MTTETADLIRHWDLPTVPFIPKWLLYSDDLTDTIHMARLLGGGLLIFIMMIAHLCMLVLYVTDKISYESLKQQSNRGAVGFTILFTLMVYWAAGVAMLFALAAPVVGGLLWIRYVCIHCEPGNDTRETAKSVTSGPSGIDVKIQDSKDAETPPADKPETIFAKISRWAAWSVPVVGITVYYTWDSGCLQNWNVLVPASSYLVFGVVHSYKDEYIGPEGKWRPLLDPYIGFCLPDAKTNEAPQDEERGASGPKNRWKWLFHSTLHFGTVLYLQYVMRAYCSSN